MPHLILEYSANMAEAMEMAEVTALGHRVMKESGLFSPNAIKSRSHKAEQSLVGTEDEAGKFFHALVYLKEGRSLEQKQALAEALMDAFQEIVPPQASLTVDVRELEKAVYRKR